MTNVLLQTWNTPFRIAPFDAISDSDFAPALDVALTRHRAEIDTIATASTPATFANTIEALEAAGQDLDKVLGTFFTVAGADSNPAREALQRDFSPNMLLRLMTQTCIDRRRISSGPNVCHGLSYQMICRNMRKGFNTRRNPDQSS